MTGQVAGKIRTVAFLSREQIDYLDKLGKDSLFYKGHKLSRARILSELVDLLMKAGIDVKKTDLRQDTFAGAVLKILNNHNGRIEEKEYAEKSLAH